MNPEIIAYASETGNRRTQAAMRAAGWRMIVPASPLVRARGFPYALDSGAWSAKVAFDKGERATPVPDLDLYEATLAKLGHGADWIALPDIVMGGAESLALTLDWLQRAMSHPVLASARKLVVVQNGHRPDQIAHLLGERVGVFIGGDDAFKLGTMGSWGALCRDRGAWCHVGRVNTARRIAMAIGAGATSFDGSSVSRFPSTLPLLDGARYQPDLFRRTV